MVPVLLLVGGAWGANRARPYVLGLPFLLFWVVTCVVLIAASLALLYHLERADP